MSSKVGHYADYSDDEFDFDDEYFTRTYQPLSNLPTPPLSSNTSAAQSPKSLLQDGGLLESELLGPAIHLVNLVPPRASMTSPSVTRVHEMLNLADLPLDTIALAVCILDSLNSRFSLNWRLMCPLGQQETTAEQAKRHTLPASPLPDRQLHIDCVNPEVIILASLIIAVKFLEDSPRPTHYYGSAWGKNMWSNEQINVTERCIMESLGYRILPLWDPELISDALSDMERAGKQVLAPSHGSSAGHRRFMSSGHAVYGLGLQMTPAVTPVSETSSPKCLPTDGYPTGPIPDDTCGPLHDPPKGQVKSLTLTTSFA
ncbi:hypothetical protein V8F06_007048 [Rhypophila decipiens]